MRSRNIRHPHSTPDMPVRVEENADGRPTALTFLGRRIEVRAVESERETRGLMMGKDQVVKAHYQLRLVDGTQAKVFKNLVTGGWYLQGDSMA